MVTTIETENRSRPLNIIMQKHSMMHIEADAKTDISCDLQPNCLTIVVLETLAFTGQQPVSDAARFARQ